MLIEYIPASSFTIQELSDLYNQTRVDYMIPMPMNSDRLAEYVHDFDIDLSSSFVAREASGQFLGLAMLGVRQQWAWVTRLGVLPASRRHGTGAALVDCLLASADRLRKKETHLEVIRNNTPAHQLFLSKGFRETGEYLVLRRAPRPLMDLPQGNITWFDREQALEALQSYSQHLTWVTALASMRNAADLQGVRVELSDGSQGWLVFRLHKFLLSHLVIQTEQGAPEQVGRQLLFSLYSKYPRHDTYWENIPSEDPHLAACFTLGFFENFRRIEMRRPMAN